MRATHSSDRATNQRGIESASWVVKTGQKGRGMQSSCREDGTSESATAETQRSELPPMLHKTCSTVHKRIPRRPRGPDSSWAVGTQGLYLYQYRCTRYQE